MSECKAKAAQPRHAEALLEMERYVAENPDNVPLKRCLDCGEQKEITAFREDKRIRGGRRTHCHDCGKKRDAAYGYQYNFSNAERGAQQAKDYRERNRDKCRVASLKSYHKRKAVSPEDLYIVRRNWRLLKTYGISDSEYARLLSVQGGVCAICKTQMTKHQRGRLHVDHDHETQAVRGLLCHNCNWALGAVKDSIEILSRMIEYVAHHKSIDTQSKEKSA